MEKTQFNAQSEPIKILRRLQRFGYKSAIIAGGAIRDDYHNKPINDYDIFLWDPRKSGEFNGIANSIATQPKLDFDVDVATFELEQGSWFTVLLDVDTIEQVYSGYGGKPGIRSQINAVWETEKDYQKYQLIYTNLHPVHHVERFFDIGLCKAYCDGEKIRYTPEFLKDTQDQTLTIVAELMTVEQIAYTIEYHAEKILKKYPRFNLQPAPHNQELFDEYYHPTPDLFSP